ncbi:MAG: LysE family transporter [Bacteroidia bacterium]|nr:LysE family transporter [Bacteroidia bacterium]
MPNTYLWRGNMYFNPILNGIWKGVLISILLFGPAFFKLLNVSIQHGFKKGILLASGVFLSDLLIVILCIFGFSEFMKNAEFQKFFTFSSAILMLMLGVKAMRHQYKAFLISYSDRSNAKGNILKGFALNLVNPATFGLWLYVTASASLKYTGEPDYKILLLINLLSILVVLFIMDTLKVYLSHLIGKKLNHRIFFLVNKYFGIILISIGVVFFIKFLFLFKVF